MDRIADDGATKGSFNRACDRCKQGGVQLAFLFRAKAWLCPICSVNACYDDAIQAALDLFNNAKGTGSPFDMFAGQVPAEKIRLLALEIQRRQREQLEGAKPATPVKGR